MHVFLGCPFPASLVREQTWVGVWALLVFSHWCFWVAGFFHCISWLDQVIMSINLHKYHSLECPVSVFLRMVQINPALVEDLLGRYFWAQILVRGAEVQLDFIPGTLNLTIACLWEPKVSRQQCWKQGQKVQLGPHRRVLFKGRTIPSSQHCSKGL